MVHIPDDYDAVDGSNQKIPLIFAFHGGRQEREAMVNGKWGDYFDQNVACVIPLGEPDPCANDQGTQWMQPTFGANTTPTDINCDPATQVVDSFEDTITYWNTSLPGTFTDVLFVEQLRSMILSRFPKGAIRKTMAGHWTSVRSTCRKAISTSRRVSERLDGSDPDQRRLSIRAWRSRCS